MKQIFLLLLISAALSSQLIAQSPNNVVTTDIVNFWEAYDLIQNESDSIKKVQILDSLYIQRGTVGLKKIMEVRNYTVGEYVHLINTYPKFFESIRPNTFKSRDLANKLNAGIDKLAALYPTLKPAKIYFTIGCMRTNGTTRDSLVLIGSELAMADPGTDISEFEGSTREWLAGYFGTNPIDGLVLL
ncbi:MAG: hypothetical protein R2792_10760, partial [Saprospiraceae bacterium]